MSCYYLKQSLYPAISQPELTWRTDYALDTPGLVYPPNETNICTDSYLPGKGVGTDVILHWDAVAGASFYVIQWCLNSSFHGPTLRAKKVATNTYEMLDEDDIRAAETVYWRVMAYNEDGGVSSKSEVWSFKWECLSQKAKQPKPGGSPDKSLCEIYNVNLKLEGEPFVFTCSKERYNLQVTFDCKDEDDNVLVEHTSTDWSIEQRPGTPVIEITASDDLTCDLEISCDFDQAFNLRAVVNFQTAEGVEFACSTAIKVTVGELKAPYYQEFLQLYFYPYYGLVSYPHEDFIGYTLSLPHTYQVYTYRDVIPIVDEDGKGAIAMGPVIEFEEEWREHTQDLCNIDRGEDRIFKREARVHIGLGCGLLFDEYYKIKVNGTELVGDGLAVADDCQLEVCLDYCGGLMLSDGCLAVDSEVYSTKTIFAIDPAGITLTPGDNCSVELAGTAVEWTVNFNCAGVVIGVTEGSEVEFGDIATLEGCGGYGECGDCIYDYSTDVFVYYYYDCEDCTGYYYYNYDCEDCAGYYYYNYYYYNNEGGQILASCMDIPIVTNIYFDYDTCTLHYDIDTYSVYLCS